MKRLLLFASALLTGLAIVFSLATANDLGPRRALLAAASLKPTWSWSFSQTGALPPRATYTRSGTRSCAAGGLLTSLGANVPCLYVDPLTGQPWGYLSEVQSTNSQLWSMDSTHWTASLVTPTANATIAPDGTTTASTVLLTATSGTHQITPVTISATTGQTYGISVFIKNMVGSSWAQFVLAGNQGFNFNPSTGAVGTTLGSATNIVVRQLPNGWWRVSFQYTSAFTSATQMSVNFSNASNAIAGVSFLGDGTSTFAIWGFQIDTAGVGVTSFMPTTSAAVTRSADMLTMPLSSLPGWNPSVGGVLVAAYRLHTKAPSSGSQVQAAAWINDGTSNNDIELVAEYFGAGSRRGFVHSGGSLVTNMIGSNGPAEFQRAKLAIGWGLNSGALAGDGAILATSSAAATLPSGLTTLNIGSFALSSLNGTIESVSYYAGARPGAFVQRVSR